MAVGVQQQQRRDTEANWVSSGKILAPGEIGFATDSKIIKMGDGVNTWDNLTIPYDGRYLPLNGKAADSEMLDGISSAGFLLVGEADTAATADKLAKRDGSGRMKAAAGAATDDVVNYTQLATATSSLGVSRSVTAAFTLALADVGKLILVNNSSSSYAPFALNVPANSSVAIPVGSFIDVLVSDKGPAVITPAGGVTVVGPLTLYGGGTSARLLKTGTDGWVVVNVCYSPGPVLRRKIKTGSDNTINAGFNRLRLDGANAAGPTGLYSNNLDTLGTNEQYNSSTDLYRAFARRSGIYHVKVQISLAEARTGRFFVQFRVNNVEQHMGSGSAMGGAAEMTTQYDTYIPLNLGDYVEAWAYQDGSGNGTINDSPYSSSAFEWAWRRPL
jgi:hypothetical protein